MAGMQLHVRMAPRDPAEPHRVATPLELFLDLAFVVAVAQAASGLEHGLVSGHPGDALSTFPLIFFAIWWAWMNFAWFASAYDSDDAAYRLATFVEMTGVLIMAAGIPRAFDEQDFAVVTIGYVVMRLALVTQWLRVAASYPAGRRTALRYAAGVALVQLGWVLRLVVPDGLWVPSSLLLIVGELTVPVWAETAGRTSWHARHMVERYGLFTIIVLGESVLSSTVAVQAALDDNSRFADLATVVVGGLLTVFSMWWIYFDLPTERLMARARREFDGHGSQAFVWGYGHYVVFAAVAATGAGLAVAVAQAAERSELSDAQAGLASSVPVAVYILAVWGLHYRDKDAGPLRSYVPPLGAALILATSVTPEPVLGTGIVLAAMVAFSVVRNRDDVAVPASPPAAERSSG
jgi:low temperature requirement protein LtrA